MSCYWTWIHLHIAWLALQMLLIIRQSRRSWMVSSIGSLMVFTVCRLYYTINFSPFLLMSFLASDDKYLLIHNTVKLSVESSFNCFPWSSSAKLHSESWSTWCTPYLGENLVKCRPFIHTVSEPQNAVSLRPFIRQLTLSDTWWQWQLKTWLGNTYTLYHTFCKSTSLVTIIIPDVLWQFPLIDLLHERLAHSIYYNCTYLILRQWKILRLYQLTL